MASESIPLWICGCDQEFMPLAGNHFFPSLCSTGMLSSVQLRFTPFLDKFGSYGENEYRVSYHQVLIGLHAEVLRNIGRVIIWSDCDIRFYDNVLPEVLGYLQEYDLVACQDREESEGIPRVLCTGFQAFRSTPVLGDFLARWIELDDLTGSDGTLSAQCTWNKLLSSSDCGLRVLPLGVEYWTVGLSGAPARWTSGAPIPSSPAGLKLHHANYTVGAHNKLALLNGVWQRHRDMNEND